MSMIHTPARDEVCMQQLINLYKLPAKDVIQAVVLSGMVGAMEPLTDIIIR